MKLTLKALRATKGWTQKQAADEIGVSKDTWFKWENGKSVPNGTSIKKIVQKLNVNYEDVLFFTDEHD